MVCQSRQHSDTMICESCGLQWDVNDPEPPTCKGVGYQGGNWGDTFGMITGNVTLAEDGPVFEKISDADYAAPDLAECCCGESDRSWEVCPLHGRGTPTDNLRVASAGALRDRARVSAVDDKTLRHVQVASGSVEAWKNFGADTACPSCGRGYGTQTEEVARLNLALYAYREAVEEFVQRVEAGEIRSSYTYTKFKKLLETL